MATVQGGGKPPNIGDTPNHLEAQSCSMTAQLAIMLGKCEGLQSNQVTITNAARVESAPPPPPAKK